MGNFHHGNAMWHLTKTRVILAVLLLALSVTLFMLSANGFAKDHDRNALWKIAQQCRDDQQQNHNPAPCDSVNLEKNYVILKDRVGVAQYLLIPTKKISGIESLAMLANDTTNYWQAAWEARHYLFKQLGRELPSDDLGMAINSSIARSQDQLHIHIDCLNQDIRNVLDQHAGEFDEHWHNIMLAGHIYHGRRIKDLQGLEPFHILAENHILANDDIKLTTLVVIGSKDGFILLYDTANPIQGDLAHGEDVLDHSCTIAK